MNATGYMDRVDARRLRAEVLVHDVLQKLRPYIAEGSEREVYYALLESFCQQGVEVLTDHVRHELGLRPRGPDGWTADEIMALEQHRLHRLLAPIAVTTPGRPQGKSS